MAQPNTYWSPPETTDLKKEIIPLSANEVGSVNSAYIKRPTPAVRTPAFLRSPEPTLEGSENERHFAALHFGLLVNDGDILQLAS